MSKLLILSSRLIYPTLCTHPPLRSAISYTHGCSSSSQKSPSPFSVRLKFYRTFHVYKFQYIYIYIHIQKHYYIHHVASPRLRESRKTRQLLIDLSHRIHGAFSSRDRRAQSWDGRWRATFATIDKDRAIRRLAKGEEDDGIIGNVTRSRERKSHKYVILPVVDG